MEAAHLAATLFQVQGSLCNAAQCTQLEGKRMGQPSPGAKKRVVMLGSFSRQQLYLGLNYTHRYFVCLQ